MKIKNLTMKTKNLTMKTKNLTMKTKNFLMAFAITSLLFYSCSKDSTSPPEVDSDITKDTTWEGIIGVKRGIHVKSGATLTIKKGTKIIFLEKNSYLLIERGGKINAVGTATEMIVFASSKKEYGTAGGVIINGYAPINQGTGSKSEIGDVDFGGDKADDNSGVLEYCRVEFGGVQITDEKEHNGFTFNGVGSGTKISHLQAYKCSDDTYEFFGEL